MTNKLENKLYIIELILVFSLFHSLETCLSSFCLNLLRIRETQKTKKTERNRDKEIQQEKHSDRKKDKKKDTEKSERVFNSNLSPFENERCREREKEEIY